MTRAIANAAKQAVPEHGQPDHDSVVRNLRRWWKKHEAAKTDQASGFAPDSAPPCPGLGVLYQVLDLKIDAILRELKLPLSADHKEQVLRVGIKIRRALEGRKEKLRNLSAGERESLVRASVIDIEGVDPAELVTKELGAIEDLLWRLYDVFEAKDLGRQYSKDD